MPKWEHNLPSDCFLRIVRWQKFEDIFTKFAFLNRQTRTIVFKNYAVICKERIIVVDLGSTTRILKKLPRYMVKRLNYIKLIISQESTSERILRLFEFV